MTGEVIYQKQRKELKTAQGFYKRLEIIKARNAGAQKKK
jgi:hypothetical protein